MKSDIIRASGKTRGIIKGKYALSLSRRWLRVAQEEIKAVVKTPVR